MLKHLRQLSTHTLIFGVGDAIARVAGLILLPVYTHILTPADYGKLAIVATFSTIAGIILDSGQRSAFFRYYYFYDSVDLRRKLTGTVFLYLLLSTFIILFPFIFFFDQLAEPLVKDASLIPLIEIALVGTFFDVGSLIPFATFRAELRARQYAILSLFRFFFNTILNIIAIVLLHSGVIGIIYANLITSIVFFIVCFILTFPSVEWTVDKSLLFKLLRFGLPIVPANLGGWALTLSDRFFLQKYADLSQVGIYALGYTIAGVLNMIMGWFNTAWAPYSFSIAKQPDARNVYARVLTYSITLFTLFGIGLTLFAPQALYILSSPAYFGAAKVVPFIVGSYIFYEMFYIFSIGFDLTGQTKYHFPIVGSAALVNLCLNFLLIPRFQMMGAALATLLSYLLLPIIEYPLVNRLYHVRYEWSRLLKLALVTLGVYLTSILYRTNLLWVDFMIGIGLVLAWFVALYLLRFFTQEELSAARSIISKGFVMLQARFASAITKIRVEEK